MIATNNRATHNTVVVCRAFLLWMAMLSVLNTSTNNNNSNNNFFVFVQGLGKMTSDQPLFESTPTHCDDMLSLHRWEGSCCSLNVTAGNGCILNVMDGNCQVRGQEWTLDYVSSYDEKPCPPSEYSAADMGMKVPDDTGSSAADVNRIVAWCCAAAATIIAVVSL